MTALRTLLRIGAVLIPLVAVPGVAAAGDVAYVSNQQGGVSVLDLATLEVKGTLDVDAKGPRGIGVTPDGRWVVTANKDDENVSVVDTASGRLVRHIAIGKNPEFVRVRGELAIVTFEPRAEGAPAAKAAAPGKDDDDDKVPGHIAVVDLVAGKVLLDIVGKPETEGVEFSRDGRQIIVANESDNSLAVYDLATGTLLRTVSVAQYGTRPRGIKNSPDGQWFVTTLEFSNKLLVLDARLTVIREVATGKFPYGVSFDRSGHRVFLTANRDQLLQVFDTGSWTKIKDIPIGERCWHFSFTPDDQKVLVACGRSNDVEVIDATTLEVTKRIGNFRMPWGIVTSPKSMGSLDQP